MKDQLKTFPRDLRVTTFGTAGDVYRITATTSGNLVGFITRGRITGNGKLVGTNRWYVDGHGYLAFRSLVDAVWALRDYFLGQLLRERVIPQLRSNDGRESVVRRMKNPRDHRLQFKREVRRERSELHDDLARANEYDGKTFH